MFLDAFWYHVSPASMAAVSLLLIFCQMAIFMMSKGHFFPLTKIVMIAVLKLTFKVSGEGLSSHWQSKTPRVVWHPFEQYFSQGEGTASVGRVGWIEGCHPVAEVWHSFSCPQISLWHLKSQCSSTLCFQNGENSTLLLEWVKKWGHHNDWYIQITQSVVWIRKKI